MTKEKLHSPLGASNAKRWIHCPGSVALIATCPPEEPSVYAKEGTIAHKFAEAAILPPDKTIVFTQEELDACDSEMVDAIRLYQETIKADQMMFDGALYVEQRFDLSHLHPALFGTNDCAMASDSMLIVYDFKYGKGVVVEVEDNEQLLYYALGAIKTLGKTPDTIEIVIVQPRAYHKDGSVRRQIISTEKLIAFAKNLKQWAKNTEDSHAPLVVGEWCQFCPAIAKCPAYQKTVEQTVMMEFKDRFSELPLPAEIDKDRLVRILQHLPMLDDWINAVKVYTLDLAKNGTVFPGFKLVQGRTNRKWIDEAVVETTLKKLLGDKIWTAPKLLSPAQIEKLFQKEDRVVVESLCHSPKGGLNLVPDTDPRPEITYDPAAEFEDNLEGGTIKK